MVKWPVLLGVISACVVIGSLAYALLPGVLWSPTVVTKVICPGLSTPPEVGYPAISPRNTCTPAFTEQDVREYFRGGFSLGHIGPVEHLKITRILFTTSRDASRLMGGESVGLPDNAVVCYVEMRGVLVGSAVLPIAPTPVVRSSRSESTIHVVFDAHTGNVVVSGETG